jgi:hypothetical protein
MTGHQIHCCTEALRAAPRRELAAALVIIFNLIIGIKYYVILLEQTKRGPKFRIVFDHEYPCIMAAPLKRVELHLGFYPRVLMCLWHKDFGQILGWSHNLFYCDYHQMDSR